MPSPRGRVEKGENVSLRGAVGDEAISFPATDCFALLAMTCTATFQTPFIVCRPYVSPVRLDRQRLGFLDRILLGFDWPAQKVGGFFHEILEMLGLKVCRQCFLGFPFLEEKEGMLGGRGRMELIADAVGLFDRCSDYLCD